VIIEAVYVVAFVVGEPPLPFDAASNHFEEKNVKMVTKQAARTNMPLQPMRLLAGSNQKECHC
jgi:hypothetical protein